MPSKYTSLVEPSDCVAHTVVGGGNGKKEPMIFWKDVRWYQSSEPSMKAEADCHSLQARDRVFASITRQAILITSRVPSYQ
jgi:hypothetical protein